MVSKISRLDFNIFSPEQIRSLARVRVVTSDLYDADGYPVEGGVMDPRMGVIDPGFRCRTCGGGIGECPGHFGYLELAKPVINVLYTKIIHYLLRATCQKCSRIMKLGIKDASKKKSVQPQKCPFCGAKQKKINFVKPYVFYEGKDELTPLTIRERFEKIPDKDIKAPNPEDEAEKVRCVSLIKTTWNIITKAKDKGVDITESEKVLNEARAALKKGDYRVGEEKACAALKMIKSALSTPNKKKQEKKGDPKHGRKG